MSSYDSLNKEQQKAVLCTEGPVLILAGAGSGKTRVLTNRIAYLIEEKHIDPWNILAVTFTNKAAEEMRERVMRSSGESARGIWVATFHSTCVRILRRHIEALGFTDSFVIYDTDDQKSLIKQILKKSDIDPKVYKEKMFMGKISRAKDEMVTPEEYMEMAGSDISEKLIAKVYAQYQKELKNNNALDFDDLLLKTVELFEKRPDILEIYQERFKYIMIDEYQDTNTVQFRFVELLAGKYRNLCVVGDDDQSIYRFRGANIRNILDFEKEYPDAFVVRLEQNYRSTEMILDVANEVIKNNKGRKTKTLWTEKKDGEAVRFTQLGSGYEEAEYIIGDISRKVRREGKNYSDFAILYRTNAQSRLFEEKLIGANIPYKLIGGVNFYARKEVKDLLAYMKIPVNTSDSLALQRIINVPKRGIGPTSVTKITEYADNNGISFFDALMETDNIPGLNRGSAKIKEFAQLIKDLCRDASVCTISEYLKRIIDKTGYVAELTLENTDESRGRIENVDELMSKVVSFEDEMGDEATLQNFLEEISLVADIDSLNDEQDYVVLMTLHSAKGLEFPDVYLAGLEEGLFPGYMSINSEDPMDIEEERRLCYVGITRAKSNLTLTAARSRMINGNTQYNPVSRFVMEIPDSMIEGEKQPFATNSIPRNEAYAQSVSAFKAKPFMKGSDITVNKADGLDYTEGDRVKHIKFGTGTVTNIRDAGRDFEVTVEFDTAGTKKMFAAFAKLKKC